MHILMIQKEKERQKYRETPNDETVIMPCPAYMKRKKMKQQTLGQAPLIVDESVDNLNVSETNDHAMVTKSKIASPKMKTEE
jgi:hypothetical protein